MVEGRRLVLTNLDKVLYPAAGTRKAELLDYYRRVHSALLPHLRDRPVSFVRFPDGTGGQRFFAKHLPPGTPAWVRTATVPSKTHGTRTHVLVEDLATLMWAGNLAALELHVPQWHAEQPGVADRLVLDLDPGEGADVLTCRTAAELLRDRLADDGLAAWVKTSGSKGLHLIVPITDTPSAEVSAYAKAIAAELERARPELLVASMAKARRTGKVFIDWSQNAAAKTTAAPYTVRARDTPTVSTPITWDELAAARRPDDLSFTIDDVPDRITDVGDLLAPLLNPRRARPLPTPRAAPAGRP
ncbi:MAG: ATP-dependent DNA ligase, partial [Streptomycetaceae bacterium]|nr:ATP-dependent DNA ligase [Streptomycetaceae bacterium]